MRIVKIEYEDGSFEELDDSTNGNKAETIVKFRELWSYKKFSRMILDDLDIDAIQEYAEEEMDMIDEDEVPTIHDFDSRELLYELKTRGIDNELSFNELDIVDNRRIIEIINKFKYSTYDEREEIYKQIIK